MLQESACHLALWHQHLAEREGAGARAWLASSLMERVRTHCETALRERHGPLLVHGAAGRGKSALLSAAAREAETWVTPRNLARVIRFSGATPRSAYGLELLRGVCQHVSLILSKYRTKISFLYHTRDRQTLNSVKIQFFWDFRRVKKLGTPTSLSKSFPTSLKKLHRVEVLILFSRWTPLLTFLKSCVVAVAATWYIPYVNCNCNASIMRTLHVVMCMNAIIKLTSRLMEYIIEIVWVHADNLITRERDYKCF